MSGPRSQGAFRPSPPNDLTVPAPGSTTGRAILSMALRKLFEDLRALRVQPSDASARDLRRLREVLVGFLPGRPGAIASLLRDPVVAAPLRCLRDGLGDVDECVAELVGQSLFQLALDRALDAPVQVERPPPVLLSPRHGAHLEVRGPWTASSRTAGEAARGAYHGLGDDLVLATRDNNPLRSLEAHPDKSGNAVDLGDHPPVEWCAAIQGALTTIGEYLPELRQEARLFLRQVVPVGFHAERHESATYREAIGTVYLSLHPDRMTMTEAIVHELSHTKLHALMELDAVLENPPDEMHASPVRPDPRPLRGVLMAVQAFVPVARLYERMIEEGAPLAKKPGFEDRFAEIVRGNAEGSAVLFEHARPTFVGAGVLDELRRWNAHFEGRFT